MIKPIHFRRAILAALFAGLLIGGLCLCRPQPAAAEVVDRIVAIVNGNIILQSDWDEALSFEALLTNRSLAQFSEDDKRAVLDRLIDQELLRQQMKSADAPPVKDAEVSARVSAARKLYPQAATEQGWQAILAQYHLTGKDLAAHVREEIELMRLVDARLRPAVQIDSKSIEAYYRDQFVPKLQQAGSRTVPLSDVSSRIRELLTEKKVNELLVSWLQTLRSEGQVHFPGISGNDTGVQSR
ncbi:MAG: SurA N-terminal domain-containing protein [Candidatus Sulfotelmatobacter sp.]